MKLTEAKQILKKAGYLLEDTDARVGEVITDVDDLITSLKDGYYFENRVYMMLEKMPLFVEIQLLRKNFRKNFWRFLTRLRHLGTSY